MESIRKINELEKKILRFLIKKSNLELPDNIYQDIFVKRMDDGEMGSFLIFEGSHELDRKRKFGREVAEFEFVDEDGIPVSVSLNVDDQNKLFEVDVWKVDFSPVIKFKVPNE